MKSLLIAVIPAGIVILLAVPCAWLATYLYQRGKKDRRSPLSGKLLRSPGQSLIPQIEDITDDINGDLFFLFMVPLTFFSIFMVQLYLGKLTLTTSIICLYVFLALTIMLFIAKKLNRRLQRRNALRLGLDAEMAVGQELNHLMLHGCRVYHDFPAEEFNIDHVVVGPGGVYAVETKGRAKPDKGRGSQDARVVYDGESLRFPDWQETKPLEQAKRQAVWLSKWLSSAIGAPVTAKAVLVLPGWFVERPKPGPVIVFNGKNPHFLTKLTRDERLSEDIIRQISHQLAQRCRDVEPSGYRKEQKKK